MNTEPKHTYPMLTIEDEIQERLAALAIIEGEIRERLAARDRHEKLLFMQDYDRVQHFAITLVKEHADAGDWQWICRCAVETVRKIARQQLHDLYKQMDGAPPDEKPARP